jgi:hypothetical protein
VRQIKIKRNEQTASLGITDHDGIVESFDSEIYRILVWDFLEGGWAGPYNLTENDIILPGKTEATGNWDDGEGK